MKVWCACVGMAVVAGGCASQEPGAAPVRGVGVEEAAVVEAVAEAPVAAAAEARAQQRTFAEFRPSEHGFRFRNGFAGSPLPFEGWGERLGAPDRFGLCGGMASAAADLFAAGIAVPGSSSTPEYGGPLYDYIYQRQVATFGLGSMPLKFVEWMGLEDEGAGGTLELSAAELPGILAALDEGQPVILGLVLVKRDRYSKGEQPKAWENHQVLAYAADRLPMGVIELRIYDPNYPGADDAVIRYMPRPDKTLISREVPGRGRTAVRGFFRMPYTPVMPPDVGA